MQVLQRFHQAPQVLFRRLIFLKKAIARKVAFAIFPVPFDPAAGTDSITLRNR
jgi:hypothetical protein